VFMAPVSARIVIARGGRFTLLLGYAVCFFGFVFMLLFWKDGIGYAEVAAGQLAAVPLVSDDLVDLTARYLPEMRLLTNIRNEYSVFSARLITEQHGMDTLTADQLFAMVVYKHLHLEDFELIQ